MAKAMVYYPLGELLHKTDRLPRRRCPQCGYGYQGQHEVCDPCRQAVKAERCEVDEEQD